ncbi:MAG: RidA family protein [Bacteroidetes bacterium]|jgi:2-iminobutanoate/2-iminopropanoate deaminase|nr:RidA family protein [Bacteroidota bacterium]MBT3748425.1 RidA family protein [Bacteroidota bacterium]MBT4398742.1 RidA family protein [Bacteroidota bacterium]MBT4411689.1 RidA family protein [Bacteroidota bacterium]MBT5425142.1 RidA family protein [Bacteroidota bacterium]
MKTNILSFLFLLFVAFTVKAQDEAAPKPVAPYSPSVMVNGTLYLSGQIPIVPETGVMIKDDIKKATEQCMKNLGVLLKKHGMTHEDLVMVNIYMTDMDNYGAINKVYAKFFPNKKFPARAAVQIGRLPLNAIVEISGIAVKSKSED